ncbi:uncharacterized protein cubi_01404 [Cryptosporidium ubiquitum]|uniref:Uncharacterized protein n=1 Tax=Cryptosporidium ubiquitum TaxID=857276 RepID=A0A1J4MDL1_9CRYT|nr:uncharacterized protein cubi_01404 [Cryptosporidium ubiquitum]OII72071.1 hypothetical protein cubi_01404 [Cryptosporidium ubiquitum]
MLLLNFKIIFVVFINFASSSYGEQQPLRNEFLEYFSIAAGINSLVFSLSNTIYSIKRFNQLKKKKKCFNEGISNSINRTKELKSRNQIINNNVNGLINIEIPCLSNEELNKDENNITQLIIQSDKLADIEMVKDENIFVGSNITDFEQKKIENIIEYLNCEFLCSNHSNTENINTNFQNVPFNDSTKRKFRGLVVE